MQDLMFIIGMESDPADLWHVLGDAGIAMEAACSFPRLEGQIMHVVVNDPDADPALHALRAAGYVPLDRREVIIAEIEPIPGELGRLAKKISDAGAKITILYGAFGNRVVIAADDLPAAAAAAAAVG